MSKIVVLIDDDQDDLDILREAILKADSSTHCISFIYPLEALRVLCDELIVRPDYIFVDINMPGMTGDGCIRELRKRKDFNDAVITVLSTSLPADVSEALKNMGANYAFKKPVTMDAYYKIVNSVLTGKKSVIGR